MFSKSNIAFVGSGMMAEAMVQGLLRQKLVQAKQLRCVDIREERVHELKTKYGVLPYTDPVKAVKDADIVVLSIKPQVLPEIFSQLGRKLKPNQIVLSILAGATIESLSSGLQHKKIVRAMPNTPARIGEGMTVWTHAPEVDASSRAQVCAILKALGLEIHVEHEIELDMATALSGTGPAYVFLFMEALVDAGVHMGFPRRIAQQLVLQTVKGSVAFASQTPTHLAELRNQVTSPGGTSAEALYQLEKGGLRTVISKSVYAAFQRSLALSPKASKKSSKE